MKQLLFTALSMIFTNCSVQKKREIYETKEVYISSISPCGSINTGNMLYCSKNVKYKILEGYNFSDIDEILNNSDFKKNFPTKIPNKYYCAKIIGKNGNSTNLVLLENSIFIVDKNVFVFLKSNKYLNFFNSLQY